MKTWWNALRLFRSKDRNHIKVDADEDLKPLGLTESVYLGVLSLGVAFMSTGLVTQAIHAGFTTAAWGDSVNVGDPIANTVAMIAITSVVYNLLTKIRNRHGLVACLEGVCWMVGLVPILYWLITIGRNALPSIDTYPYLGLILWIGAICLHILRSQLTTSSATAASDVHSSPPTDPARLAEDAISDPPPRQQEADTRTRKWVRIVAAGALLVVAVLVARSFPLLTSESSDGPVDDCRSWYNERVVPIFNNTVPQWVGWGNALDSFIEDPERNERLMSDINVGKAPVELLSRSKVGNKWFAAQDLSNVEVERAALDGHWDDDEVTRAAAASAIEMRAIVDLLALDDLLANTVGFPPFPHSQSLGTDLRRAILGLEKACGLG